jgi:hypothetical protein
VKISELPVTLGRVNQMRLRVVFICTSLTLRSSQSVYIKAAVAGPNCQSVYIKAAVAGPNCQLVYIKATVGLFENLSLLRLII